MEHLEDERHYGARQESAWLPQYRLGHTVLLVVLSGIAGWYGIYRAATWLIDLLS